MAERTILVAEDDASIRAGLSDALQAHGYGVLTAADGEAALKSVLTQEVDLVLLDLNMPKLNGFKLLKIMSKECPGVPSIILTAHGEEKDRVRGLENGADDYVVKPFSMAELLARVAAVLRRYPTRRVSAEKALHFPGGSLNPDNHSVVMDNGSCVALRDKEFELFYYFLAHPDRIISQEELLLRVWGSRANASETRTVAVTLTRLREKLDPAVAQRIENVRGRGYKWSKS